MIFPLTLKRRGHPNFEGFKLQKVKRGVSEAPSPTPNSYQSYQFFFPYMELCRQCRIRHLLAFLGFKKASQQNVDCFFETRLQISELPLPGSAQRTMCL